MHVAGSQWLKVVAEEPARSLVVRSGDVLATVQVRHGYPPENAYIQTIPTVAPAVAAMAEPGWLRHGRMLAVAAVALTLPHHEPFSGSRVGTLPLGTASSTR